MATGPPLMWKETVGSMAIRSSPVIGKDPGIEAPPVCRRREQAGVPGVAYQCHVIPRRLHGAEAGLGEPDAVPMHVVEVRAGEARLQDDGAAVHAHAAGPVMLEALEGRDRQRLDPGGVLRPARHVYLGGGDRRGGAAVDVAREVAHGVLARREVAEGDVDLGIDQPGDRRRAAGVDHDIAGVDGGGGHRRRRSSRIDRRRRRGHRLRRRVYASRPRRWRRD